MADYAYYPGCSLETTASSYDKSIREVFKALGIGLHEIEDWNCCGATMYFSVNKTAGLAVAARNLAIAQRMDMPICAPCSSCYTILKKTNKHLDWEPEDRARVNQALAEANLSYDKHVDIRHPVDILINEVGIDKITAMVKTKLSGLKVAPYYGCQIVRPDGVFDDVDEPTTMDRLLEATGATVVNFPPKVRCCGGMLMTTGEDIALKLNLELLQAAVDSGANIIATACPLCEMNLGAYQDKINARYGRNFNMPIVYFSHLIGIALGIDPQKMGLDSFIVSPTKVLAKATEGAR